jgi:GntR family transcriptional regulator
MTSITPSNTAPLPKTQVDRNSPVPYYFQLAGILEQQIVSQAWRPGDRMPSEPELCEHFGVSRSTVRQALERLEHAGLIARRKGYGTYVADTRRRSWLLQSAEGFFQDEVERLGSAVTSKVRKLDTGELPAWATEALELPEGSQGVTIERLRAVDGDVALYVVNHLPIRHEKAAQRLVDPNESLYRALAEEDGVTVAGARRVLQATEAGKQLARLLEVKPGTAVAFIESVSWDADMRPFDCYRAWVRTDRLKIDVQVTAPPAHLSPAAVQARGAT